VNFDEVTFIDRSGEPLLRTMSNQGAQFVASDVYVEHVLDWRIKTSSRSPPQLVDSFTSRRSNFSRIKPFGLVRSALVELNRAYGFPSLRLPREKRESILLCSALLRGFLSRNLALSCTDAIPRPFRSTDFSSIPLM
jgi:hypothetical protein